MHKLIRINLIFITIINIMISGNLSAQPASKEIENKIKELIQLHIRQKNNPSLKSKALEIIQDMKDWKLPDNAWPVQKYSKLPLYNGTDKSMVSILVYASNFTSITLSCDVIEKAPGLILAAQPYYGSTRDNFLPQLTLFKFKDGELIKPACKTNFPFDVFKKYIKATTLADRNYLRTRPQEGGTIVYAIIKGYINIYAQAIWAPWLFKKVPEEYKFPYEKWAKKSNYNKNIFNHIRQKYLIAKKQLTKYWISKGYNKEKAENFARASLFRVPFGTI